MRNTRVQYVLSCARTWNLLRWFVGSPRFYHSSLSTTASRPHPIEGVGPTARRPIGYFVVFVVPHVVVRSFSFFGRIDPPTRGPPPFPRPYPLTSMTGNSRSIQLLPAPLSGLGLARKQCTQLRFDIRAGIAQRELWGSPPSPLFHIGPPKKKPYCFSSPTGRVEESSRTCSLFLSLFSRKS